METDVLPVVVLTVLCNVVSLTTVEFDEFFFRGFPVPGPRFRNFPPRFPGPPGQHMRGGGHGNMPQRPFFGRPPPDRMFRPPPFDQNMPRGPPPQGLMGMPPFMNVSNP